MSFGVLDEKTISIDSDMGRASVHDMKRMAASSARRFRLAR
jgi:hypothetical protein